MRVAVPLIGELQHRICLAWPYRAMLCHALSLPLQICFILLWVLRGSSMISELLIVFFVSFLVPVLRATEFAGWLAWPLASFLSAPVCAFVVLVTQPERSR